MPFIYVLKSSTTGPFYTGATTDIDARLAQHNSDQCPSTKHRGPWVIVHQEEFATLAEALRRKKVLKTGRGRDEVRRILAAKEGPGRAIAFENPK
jgi:putative endonuclease